MKIYISFSSCTSPNPSILNLLSSSRFQKTSSFSKTFFSKISIYLSNQVKIKLQINKIPLLLFRYFSFLFHSLRITFRVKRISLFIQTLLNSKKKNQKKAILKPAKRIRRPLREQSRGSN